MRLRRSVPQTEGRPAFIRTRRSFPGRTLSSRRRDGNVAMQEGIRMADIINLRQIRKDRNRRERAAEADRNATRFGRTKSERRKEEAETERQSKTLDGHKIEDET